MDNLPDLPMKRVKREAEITPKVLQYFRENYKGSCALEIKATLRRTIPKSALESHQEAALYAAASGTLAHKISDAGHVRNPFDAFVLSGVPAYVVACFLHADDRIALAIPIEKWQGATPTTDCAFSIAL